MSAPVSYIDFQQLRGRLVDAVDWAISRYDGFMLDDAYDSQRVLDEIIAKLREVRNEAARVERNG